MTELTFRDHNALTAMQKNSQELHHLISHSTANPQLLKNTRMLVIFEGPSEHKHWNIFVCSGTGSLLTGKQIHSKLQIEQALYEAPYIKSIKNHIDAMRRVMGLNMFEIASIMNVSRQSIYDWTEGTSKLRRQHQRKLDTLSNICSAWSQMNLGRLGSYLNKKIDDEKVSLLQLLQEKEINKDQILQVLKKIACAIKQQKSAMESHDQILKNHGHEKISKSEMIKNLDKITRKIG